MLLRKFWKEIVSGVVIAISLTIIITTFVNDAAGTKVPAAISISRSPVASASPVKDVAKKVAPAPSATIKSETITYVVSGSPAHISYGVDASESATSPLRKTEAIKGSYYSIVVRMDDGGTKTKLVVKIDGVTVAKTYATPEHPLASIAIAKEYGSKNWMAVPSTS